MRVVGPVPSIVRLFFLSWSERGAGQMEEAVALCSSTSGLCQSLCVLVMDGAAALL